MLAEDELREAILLVFANKQDLPNAMSVNEVTERLGLNQIRNRQWYFLFCVFFCRNNWFLQVYPSYMRDHGWWTLRRLRLALEHFEQKKVILFGRWCDLCERKFQVNCAYKISCSSYFPMPFLTIFKMETRFETKKQGDNTSYDVYWGKHSKLTYWANFLVQSAAILSWPLRSFLNLFAISGTRGSSEKKQDKINSQTIKEKQTWVRISEQGANRKKN